MLTRRYRAILSVLLPLLVVCLALIAGRIPSASAQGPRVLGPFVGPSVKAASFDGDVRTLPRVNRAATYTPRLRARLHPPALEPTIRQNLNPAPIPNAVSTMPSPLSSFKGISQTAFPLNFWPPDPVGDVGSNHYIQGVNSAFAIYTKTGELLASIDMASFFTGTSSFCDINPRGDPVVLYDALADRWVLSFLAFYNPLVGDPFYECIAVSKTSDPVTGGWWFYALLAHPSYLNDYPKLSVWRDAYYMTANLVDLVNGSAFKGVRVWALDRASMLSGTLNSVYFDIPWDGQCCYSLLPSHMHGTPPLTGTPNFLMAAQAITPSTAVGNHLLLWKFYVNWTTPASSTLSSPISITVNSFRELSGLIVPQLGSGETPDIGDSKLMMQLQYRRLYDLESLWAVHMISGTRASAIRWYEVRNPNAAPILHQQGTFEPDSVYRWMPSLAADKRGNMAIGYSVSSSSMYPAIRYAGRTIDDPLGVLAQGETSLIEGSGSQSGGFYKWGDYSAMSVDPVDGCTFWYTNMYYETTGNNWQTRIGTFKFPWCEGRRYYIPTIFVPPP